MNLLTGDAPSGVSLRNFLCISVLSCVFSSLPLRFDIFFRLNILKQTGDMENTYNALVAFLREQLPQVSAADMFFEKDLNALRLEMTRAANTKATGDRVPG